MIKFKAVLAVCLAASASARVLSLPPHANRHSSVPFEVELSLASKHHTLTHNTIFIHWLSH